jgi:hypothetical protein
VLSRSACAAICLARLWREQGRMEAARGLREAKALLDELT